MSATNTTVAVPNALLCTPIFSPDPGHKDTQIHSKASKEWFYGVVTKNWKGIVTSKEAVDRLTAKDPTARTFKAPTWGRIHELWHVDCAERHDHEAPLLPVVVNIASDFPFSRPTSRAPLPTKVSRHTPSPTKPASMSKSKTVGIQFCIPPFHTANDHLPCQLVQFDPLDQDTAAIAARFEAWSINKEQAPLMFAVSGTSRIFRDRYSALAAFLEIPSVELFYTYDEDVVLDFINKEAAQMLKKKKAEMLRASCAFYLFIYYIATMLSAWKKYTCFVALHCTA
ncbi:hypothetical protein B0H19DRAFT_1058946 [Mycena capillaripes]|nr:hypothetical protein B0H19DRAFT_1058946 [Mycena capillaripes]